jgi:hypothetical protein
MRADDFISCPDHLIASAIAHGERLQQRGYGVAIEQFDLAFPSTPHFIARRNKETLIVEVMDVLDWARLAEWSKYAKACSTETRVMVGLSRDIGLTVSETSKLSQLGIGATVWDGTTLFEVVSPQDLALNMEPPSIPPGLEKRLGHAYDQIEHGNWREGFEESCLVLEQEARAYLRAQVRNGKIRIVPKNPSSVAIGKMTLGQLADQFDRVWSPNSVVSRIGQALHRVNADRISVVHYKNVNARREGDLRRRFGKNMMVLINALKMIRGL